MTVNLSALAGAGQQFFTDTGVPLSGGKLYSYAAGTTTPQATYTTSTGSIAHANPIILDSAGRISTGEIWLTAGSNYKFVLKTSTDTTIATWDNITGINGTGIATNAANVQYDPAGTGAVSETAQAKMRQTINVLDFGADNTGATDATSKIQAAIDAAYTLGQQVVAYGTFKTSAKIVFKGNADFSEATFNVYSTPTVAVEVSTGTATNPTDVLNNSVIWLPKVITNMTKPGTGWAGQGIGVRLVNTYSCQIFVGNVVNFATGLQMTSFDTGNVYNNIYLGHLENNQVNLALTPGNASAYVNENNFYGGRYSQYSSEGTAVAGCYHILISAATSVVNNNIFYKPSVEGNTPQYHVTNAGTYITIIQGRWEAATPKVNYVGNTASQGTNNIIAGGYNVDSIVFSYTGSSSSFLNKVDWAKDNNYNNGSSSIGIYKYQNAFGSSAPIYTFYPAGTQPETATSTQWAVKHSSQVLQGKRVGDGYARMKIDYYNGELSFGDGSIAPDGVMFGGGGYIFAYSSTSFSPYPNNTMALGSSGYRWTTVYATTGTINTSDANQKQDIADLDEAEKRVALAIKQKIKKFKFKDAVATKGDAARIHVGVIAQEVMAAFTAEGLDAMRYGLMCYDEWQAEAEEKDSEGAVIKPAKAAGNSYGIRYEELLAFIIGAM